MSTSPALTIVLAVLVLAAWTRPCLAISNSKHNLSFNSGNNVRASSEDEICVFCHTPHKAYQTKPLWNRSLDYQTSTLYSPYTSTTLDAAVGQPTGAAKLCLSCHDGTVAIGSVLNLNGAPANIPMQGAVTTMPAGPTNLGTNLTNDHPVSLVPNLGADPEIAAPPAGDPVRLDDTGRVQCTSCHNPHLDNPPNYKFLVKDNASSALCLTCHNKPGWSGSRHQASQATYPASGTTTVSQNACLNCHTPHNAASPSRLLQTNNLSFGAPLAWAEENVCFQCHQSGGTGIDPVTGVAAPNINGEFGKTSRHPFDLKLNEHQPVFTSHLPAPETTALASKHVECQDCHNPHQVRPLAAVPPGDQGNVLTGMKGIDINGIEVTDPAGGGTLLQYQICFRCHGDNYATFIPPAATRPPGGSNKRLEFQTTNAAYHPVAGTGRNQSAVLNSYAAGGQLRGNDWQGNALSRSSTLKCTDCHNNNAYGGAATFGSPNNYSLGPRGPHGSSNARLLRAAYYTTIPPNVQAYAANNFAECFLCHDEARLRGTQTNFMQNSFGAGRGNLHNLHLTNIPTGGGRSLAVCHECHYNVHSNVEAANTIYFNVGANPTHLVNFAPNVAANGGQDPNQPGVTPVRPVWGKVPAGDPGGTGGPNRYYCFLSCHGSTKMDGDKTVYDATDPQP